MSSSVTNTNLDEEDDLFYFESDHLALKGNKEYSEVLKTIFILESQRARAIKDYETIVEIHKQALDDPITFIQKLKNGESLGIPDLQNIIEVPTINWTKYDVPIPKIGLKLIKGEESEKTASPEDTVKTRNKHETHNKPWTSEEQKRLEELLVVYPPEPIELRRFKKVAAALGNRTVKQVSSRVQKYFLKLYNAGLPIPGRVPKAAKRNKKSKLHVHQRFNHYLWKPTTFFPELDVPVTMDEMDEVPGPSLNSKPGTEASTSNYLISNAAAYQELKCNESPKNSVDIQLDLLRRVKYEKQRESYGDASLFHDGYRCDYCDEEPIKRVRWHCLACKEESVDFCTDCVVAQMFSEDCHPVYHKLVAVRLDGDYSSSGNGGFSSDSEQSGSEGSDASDANNRVEQDLLDELNDVDNRVEQDLPDELNNQEQTSSNLSENVTRDTSITNIKRECKIESDFETVDHDIQDYENIYDHNSEHDTDMKEYAYLDVDPSDENFQILVNNYSDGVDRTFEQNNEMEVSYSKPTTLTDTQNVSYSYLHSNLNFDDPKT